MDEITFDALTRSVGTDARTRRTLLRLLVGTALGAVAARLGQVDDAEARAKPSHGNANARSQAHPNSGVQSERKSKGKGKGKGKGHKPPPLPPGCKNCNACQMCKNGT